MKTLFRTVDLLERAMSFHRDRHAILAGNVANIDTPGARPLDLERVPAGQNPAAPTLTHTGHIAAPRGGPAGDVQLAFDDTGALVDANGNTIQLERELAKIDANRVRYGTSSELVSRKLAILRYAAGDGTP